MVGFLRLCQHFAKRKLFAAASEEEDSPKLEPEEKRLKLDSTLEIREDKEDQLIHDKESVVQPVEKAEEEEPANSNISSQSQIDVVELVELNDRDNSDLELSLIHI